MDRADELQLDALRIVSVDDHLVEPPQLWTDRLPAKYADIGPHVVRTRVSASDTSKDPDHQRTLLSPVKPDEETVWCDIWHFEEERYALTRAAGGLVSFEPEKVDRNATTYDDIRPGCFQWKDRLIDMEFDGVDASLVFPNSFVQFCGQRFIRAQDRELALLCIRAYNDFLVEEWSVPSGGRLLGSAILPLWDVDLAVVELERIAARSCPSICFSEIPARLNLPSLYSREWDALFGACERNNIVISIHIGSSSSMPSSPDAPPSVANINFFSNTALSLTDWIMSGVLIRFPELKIAFSEGQAGWVPYLMNRMEVMWRNGLGNHEVRHLPNPPHYYLRNVFFCIFDDWVGLSHLDILGEDNVCFETDYPHPDGTYPDSLRVAHENTKSLTADQREKVLRSNAVNLYGFKV